MNPFSYGIYSYHNWRVSHVCKVNIDIDSADLN